jgi:hypothetical protein
MSAVPLVRPELPVTKMMIGILLTSGPTQKASHRTAAGQGQSDLEAPAMDSRTNPIEGVSNMTPRTITGVATILLALSAAVATAQTQSSTMAQGRVDTRTAKQFDDYNPSIVPPPSNYNQGSAEAPRTAAQYDDYNPAIKPPPFGYDAAGGSVNKDATGQYKQGTAQSLTPSAVMVNQDKH